MSVDRLPHDVRMQLDKLRTADRTAHDEAFTFLREATASPVDWAYDAWDELLAHLSSKNNRVRSIAAQVLSNLAQSDPEERMMQTFDALLNVTRDERFVTARHCLLSLWKVALPSERHRRMVVAGLEQRFNECASEKNWSLIRYDIIEVLRRIYDETGDESVAEKARALIASEEDEKYRKKYARVWR